MVSPKEDNSLVSLGFSIYPEHHEVPTIKTYMALLKKYGAKRIFMSLLQIETDDVEMFDKYKEIIDYANQLQMKVIADISPDFVKQNAWEGQLAEKAKEFGLAGLRLDEDLPLEEIVALTNNDGDLKIELNMSTDKKLLTELLESNANIDNVIGCHNFYPHEFTGLSIEHFNDMSQFYHENGIETAAFISSQTAEEGPWPVSEGLPTIEEYRHLPIYQQVQLLKAAGTIDNILISNQFISENELKECLDSLDATCKHFDVDVIEDITTIERQIVEFEHHYRGDISSYVLRSTIPRTVYTKDSIPPRDSQSKIVTRGSIIIDNDRYLRYKGELQIALKTFSMSDKANIVGQISPDSLSLLDYLKPWEDFRLRVKRRQ